MAGTTLIALIDDIASILDDVATMTKVAAKKTAGVLGDDLALNAQQVNGIQADRELPVVWAVMKGSFVNKAILVPAALLISAFFPWLITPLLMVGGLFLCFEGAEKLHHKLTHGKKGKEAEHSPAALSSPVPEKERIKGAVRTDFILSAEIIVISLGTMANADLTARILGLSAIAILMTVGVYGLVAAIVKADDLGLYLMSDERPGLWRAAKRKLGYGLVRSMPGLMKGLTVAGTAAMFLVGGAIVLHGLPFAHGLESLFSDLPSALRTVANMVAEGLFGVVAGFLTIPVVMAGAKIWGALRGGGVKAA